MEIDAPKTENKETALVPYEGDQMHHHSNDSNPEPNKGTDWVQGLTHGLKLIFSSDYKSFKRNWIGEWSSNI